MVAQHCSSMMSRGACACLSGLHAKMCSLLGPCALEKFDEPQMSPDQARDAAVPWPSSDPLPVCFVPGSSVGWLCWVLPANSDTSFVDSCGGATFHANDFDQAMFGIEQVARALFPSYAEQDIFENKTPPFCDDSRGAMSPEKEKKTFNHSAFLSGEGSRSCQELINNSSKLEVAELLCDFPIFKALEDKHANYVLAAFLDKLPRETADAVFSKATRGDFKRWTTGKFSYRIVRYVIMNHGSILSVKVATNFIKFLFKDVDSLYLAQKPFGRYVFEGALRSSWLPFVRAASELFLDDLRKTLTMHIHSFFLARLAVETNQEISRPKVQALQATDWASGRRWRMLANALDTPLAPAKIYVQDLKCRRSLSL